MGSQGVKQSSRNAVISSLEKVRGVNASNEVKDADLESKIDLEELIFVGGELDVLEDLKSHTYR